MNFINNLIRNINEMFTLNDIDIIYKKNGTIRPLAHIGYFKISKYLKKVK